MKFAINKSIIGSLYASIAFLMGTLMSASVKWIGDDIPLFQIIFLRFLVGLFFLIPICWKNERKAIFKITNWQKHLLRAILGILAISCFYYAVNRMSFVNYSTLHHIYPLFVMLLSFFFLKEKIKLSQWLAIILGFLGVLIITNPTTDVSLIPVLTILVGSFIAAGSDILVKNLTKTESSFKIVLYFFGFSTIFLGFFMPYVWVTPKNYYTWIGILIVGISGVSMQYLLTQSYRFLKASTVGVWRYSEFLWALLFGLGVWKETPNLNLWFGAFIIFMSSFIIQHLKLKKISRILHLKSQVNYKISHNN